MLSDKQIEILKEKNLLNKFFEKYLLEFGKQVIINPKPNPNFEEELETYLKKKGYTINHVKIPVKYLHYGETGQGLFIGSPVDMEGNYENKNLGGEKIE